MIRICSGRISNFGAILSKSVVMVASIEAWDCGVDAATVEAFAVVYLLVDRNTRLYVQNPSLAAIPGLRTLVRLRIIIPSRDGK